MWEILTVHAKDVLMDDTVDLDAIALATSGAVGSDLANMINEAAINAVKQGRDYVCQKDLFEAVEQVLVGKEKKDRIMSKRSGGSYPITKWAMRWYPPFRRIPNPCRRSPLFPEPWALWDMSCRCLRKRSS